MYRVVLCLAAAHAMENEGTEQTGLLQLSNRGQINDQSQQAKQSASSSLQQLFETVKEMLRKGATEPVVSFTKATVLEIEEKVLPAIRDAHEADKQLEKSHRDRLERIRANMTAELHRREQVQASTNQFEVDHQHCRANQKMTCNECDNCTAACETQWELVQSTQHQCDMNCEKLEANIQDFTKIGNNTYTWTARKRSERYMKICEEHLIYTWVYNKMNKSCEETCQKEATEQQDCDLKKESFERDACSTQQFDNSRWKTLTELWNEAKAGYDAFCRELVEVYVPDRKIEWKTITTVDCLLNEVAETGCDDPTGKVKECEDKHGDYTFLDLSCQPVEDPPTPPPRDPVCSMEWQQKKYGSWPSDPCNEVWPPCVCVDEGAVL